MLKKVNQKGFTIIEVLIVLAIAGVIMLVVFLAVPALQRSSRNTQRTNDASLISAAVTECLTNNNGQKDKCNDITIDDGATATGSSKLKDYVDPSKLRQLTSVKVDSGTSFPADGNSAYIVYGHKCDTSGAAVDTGTTASSKQFVLLFKVETTSTLADRCLDS